jgi:16S rRNA processing protein RimM
VRLLQFADVDSIEEAEPLVGTVLAVDEQELTPPAPGQYFVYQLEGLDVFTVAGERLGAIVRVFPTGSNEVLVVQNGEREHLIPMIADVVQSVDMASRRVVIEPIAGLLE